MRLPGVHSFGGTLAEPCARCGVAKVEVASLSKLARGLIVLVALLSAVLIWVESKYQFEVQLLVLALGLFDLLFGESAVCRACGAKLQKEIGQGWR